MILFTTVDDKNSTARFRYSEHAVRIMKSVPTHRWSRTERQWVTETAWVPLLAKRFHDAGFEVAIDGEVWVPPDAKAVTPCIVALFDALPSHLRVPAYRALSKVLHPDAGGDLELMKQLNAAMEAKR